MNNKVKSFTLPELLVAMLITVIVVGLAFVVLNLVKKDITRIEKNYYKTSQSAFFKQQIWIDFNKNSEIKFIPEENKIIFKSNSEETLFYNFSNDYIIRNTDTLKTKMKIQNLYFQGDKINEGEIDAISFTEKNDIANSSFFVFKKNDATLYMNDNGF